MTCWTWKLLEIVSSAAGHFPFDICRWAQSSWSTSSFLFFLFFSAHQSPKTFPLIRQENKRRTKLDYSSSLRAVHPHESGVAAKARHDPEVAAGFDRLLKNKTKRRNRNRFLPFTQTFLQRLAVSVYLIIWPKKDRQQQARSSRLMMITLYHSTNKETKKISKVERREKKACDFYRRLVYKSHFESRARAPPPKIFQEITYLRSGSFVFSSCVMEKKELLLFSKRQIELPYAGGWWQSGKEEENLFRAAREM